MTRTLSTETAERLLRRLRARRDEMTDLLRRLVEIETPSTVPASQGPAFDLLANALRDVGHAVRLLPGRRTGGLLYSRPASDGAPFQLLLGHVDTVWPLGTLEGMPVEIRGRVFRGPGSFDMKAGLVQMVFALRALRTLERVPSVAPVVLITSDEELGSGESVRQIQRLARRARRAFVLEPALGEEGRIKTARKGVGSYTIRIRGVSAHSGLAPEEGASAIGELAHVIGAFHALSEPERGITLNVGRVRGGTRSNVVAAEAEAEVDVRILRAEDGDRVDREIRSIEPEVPGTRIEVHGGLNRLPLERTPRNRALWRAASRLGSELGLELEEGTSGGGSDGNFTSLHTATLDGLGAVGDGAHALHEWVDLERMPERAALLALLLLLPADATPA